MEIYNKLIDGENLLHIYTTAQGTVQNYWQNEIELIYVLKGEAIISFENNDISLTEDTLLLINSNEVHTIKIDERVDTRLFKLRFSKKIVRKFKVDEINIKFNLNSIEQSKLFLKEINEVKKILAKILNLSINKIEPLDLYITKYFYDLVLILFNNFTQKTEENIGFIEQEKLLLKILKFIDEHYKEQGLTLKNIANELNLTPQYISSYFSKHMGVQLKKYLSNLRLNKSLMELKYSKESIINIAISNGFPDSKSYYRTFQENMKMSPGEYRKKHSNSKYNTIEDNIIDSESKEHYTNLLNYIDYNKSNSILYETYNYNVDTSKSIGIFDDRGKNVLSVGHVSLLLKSNVMEKLKKTKEDMGFQYISIYGIFDKQMQLYNEDREGEVFYNFNNIDYIFDNLLELNLKPFIQLSFMPEQLASETTNFSLFESNISKPKSYSKWGNLIKAFIEHLVTRYSYEEIYSWYFSIWYKPDIPNYTWYNRDEDFFELVKTTFKTIKNIDKNIKIGGFSNYIINKKWLSKIAEFCKNNNIILDFASFLVHGMEINILDDSFYAKGYKNKLGKLDHKFEKINESSLMKVEIGEENMTILQVQKTVQLLESLNIFKKDYWAIEYCSTSFSEDLTHDTLFMAPYILKNSIAIRKYVNGLGYWNFIDSLDVVIHETPLFYGGYGMLTINGLRKPHYLAYSFLNRMKKQILLEEEGILITRDRNSIQILAYNYCHFNDIYSKFDTSQISQKVRYNVFRDKLTQHLIIELQNLHGKFIVEKYFLNRDNGSVFDAWVAIGAPHIITKEAYAYLNTKIEPRYYTNSADIKSTYKLKLELEKHEVQFINIKLINTKI